MTQLIVDVLLSKRTINFYVKKNLGIPIIIFRAIVMGLLNLNFSYGLSMRLITVFIEIF